MTSPDHDAARRLFNSLRACERCGAWDDPSHTAEECDTIVAQTERQAQEADPRYVGTFAAPDVRGLVNHLRASPLYHSDPLLHATIKRITLGDDPLRALGEAVLLFAEERARLLKMATAAAISIPVILAPVDAFAAPAHNPGARVVATGGGR